MVKIKSTYNKFREKLTLQKRIKFDEGYRDFLHSELVIALKADDKEAVKAFQP